MFIVGLCRPRDNTSHTRHTATYSRVMLPVWTAQAAWNAVKAAARPRVHVFLATSPIHMQFKLNMTEDQVVANSVRTVQHLRSLGCQDIEFSPEDATRWGRRQSGRHSFLCAQHTLEWTSRSVRRSHVATNLCLTWCHLCAIQIGAPVPVPRAGGGDQGRRHDGEHPGHHRVGAAARVWRSDRRPEGQHAGHR